MTRRKRAQKRMQKQQEATQENRQPKKRGVLELVVDGGELVADSGKPEAAEPVRAVAETAPEAEPAGGESEELNDRFFDEAPVSFPPQEIWGEDLSRPPRRSRGSRFAQYTTFAMMGVFLVGIGSYMFYARVIMPTPVEVGLAGGTLQSPFPETDALRAPPPSPADFARAAASQPVPESAGAIDTVEPAAESVAEAVVDPEPTPAPAQAVETAKQNEMAAAAAAVPIAAAEPSARTAASIASKSRTATASNAATRPAPKPEAKPARNESKGTAVRRSAPIRRRALSRSDRSRRSESGSQPNRADVLRKMAYHYLNVGRHRDAERYASQAVGADPRSSQGWILLGLARDALQDREGAKSAFQRCTQAEGPYVSECRRLKAGYM